MIMSLWQSVIPKRQKPVNQINQSINLLMSYELQNTSSGVQTRWAFQSSFEYGRLEVASFATKVIQTVCKEHAETW